MVQFKKPGDSISFQHIDGPQGKNGFEYLGFRFDGRKVYVRDSTISRFYRKVAIGARREAIKHFWNNPGLDILKLQKSFNYTLLSQRFTRVNRTDFVSDDVRTWTFWTYLKRAAEAFGDDGSEILKQASGFRKFMHERVDEALSTMLLKQATKNQGKPFVELS